MWEDGMWVCGVCGNGEWVGGVWICGVGVSYNIFL